MFLQFIIDRIRNTHASKGISGEFQSLVEEKICMEVSELAEQFLQRLKKLQQVSKINHFNENNHSDTGFLPRERTFEMEQVWKLFAIY